MLRLGVPSPFPGAGGEGGGEVQERGRDPRCRIDG